MLVVKDSVRGHDLQLIKEGLDYVPNAQAIYHRPS